MAFAAGVLLGVVSFDILPEVMEMIKTYDFSPRSIMIALVAGFLSFHLLKNVGRNYNDFFVCRFC
jgi:hypothetical protein